MTEPNILERASARHDWETRDPGNVALPLKGRTHEPKCHCPAKPKRNQLGGCKPAIDMQSDLLVCKTCRKPIGNHTKTKQVKWLRGLLETKIDRPDHFDAPSLREVGLLIG